MSKIQVNDNNYMTSEIREENGQKYVYVYWHSEENKGHYTHGFIAEVVKGVRIEALPKLIELLNEITAE